MIFPFTILFLTCLFFNSGGVLPRRTKFLFLFWHTYYYYYYYYYVFVPLDTRFCALLLHIMGFCGFCCWTYSSTWDKHGS
ncbi:hypothetical protein F4774DRAFT_101592 [Daldinia eschscholtzii]|nr:hypothetical protein F4774DRAFT_101592 [Daldinia eschscholtzii]